jgi:MoaA/NifB/PqqE/SkfB family radical SAM enzyme
MREMIRKVFKALFNKIIWPRYPLLMMLIFNDKCNLRCKFCEIGLLNAEKGPRELSSRELSRDGIDKCLQLCLKANIKNLLITGGEVFLSQNLWYALEKCRENDLIVDAVATNGTFLDSLSGERIALINKAVREIFVSIDGADASAHDENRGVPGTFEKLERFFSNEAKRKLFDTNFSFLAVVNSKNIRQLKGIVDLALKWKIDHIIFAPVSTDAIFFDKKRNYDKSEFTRQFDIKNYESIMEDLHAYCRDKKISNNLAEFRLWTPSYFKHMDSKEFFFEKALKKHLCSVAFNFIYVNYNGDLLPCPTMKPFANIDDEDCFKKWAKHGQALKKRFEKGDYFNECRYCYCEHPWNLRLSLLYFPLANIGANFKLYRFYGKRHNIKARHH